MLNGEPNVLSQTRRPDWVRGESIATILPKLHESYQKAVKDRLNTLPLTAIDSISDIPSLDQTFLMLGKASSRLMILNDVLDLIHKGDGRYSCIRGKVREIDALKANCQRQLELLHEMARAIIHKEIKDASLLGHL